MASERGERGERGEIERVVASGVNETHGAIVGKSAQGHTLTQTDIKGGGGGGVIVEGKGKEQVDDHKVQ